MGYIFSRRMKYVWVRSSGITVDFSHCLIVFGPGKLPTIGSALGKSLREFKDAVNSAETGNEASTAETEKETKKEDTDSNQKA